MPFLWIGPITLRVLGFGTAQCGIVAGKRLRDNGASVIVWLSFFRPATMEVIRL